MDGVAPSAVVFPGSFDPIHNGHLDLIERAGRVFPQVIVAVLKNVSKAQWFSVEDRMRIVRESVKSLPNVRVEQSAGLLAEFVEQSGAHLILRGIRSGADLDYERPMAITNQALAPGVETIFLLASPHFAHLSATLVKELAVFGADLSRWVPPAAQAAIARRSRQENDGHPRE